MSNDIVAEANYPEVKPTSVTVTMPVDVANFIAALCGHDLINQLSRESNFEAIELRGAIDSALGNDSDYTAERHSRLHSSVRCRLDSWNAKWGSNGS